MKQITLKLAVISALSMSSAHVMADWVTLSPTGYAVAAGYNYSGSPAGTTAYTICNPTGDFGSSPTTDAVNTADACYVVTTNEAFSPDSTYTGAARFPIASANRPIIVNNTYTGGVNKTIGNMQEYVWRKSTGGGNFECIYGAKITMISAASADYLPVAGTQYFESNDFARGGFGGSAVDIGYWRASSTASNVYRAGYTYSAVQHRASSVVPEFAELPLTTPAFTGSINGVDSWPQSTVPAAAQQSASINTNWIDFTSDVNVLDDDGSSKAASSMFYIRTACTSATPAALANSVRVRQTFQELNGDGTEENRFIEATLSGFAPAGGSIGAGEAHTDPY
ncbi:MAG: hypothetical protein ACSHWN_11430 [Methylophilaceae bacterium]